MLPLSCVGSHKSVWKFLQAAHEKTKDHIPRYMTDISDTVDIHVTYLNTCEAEALVLNIQI